MAINPDSEGPLAYSGFLLSMPIFFSRATLILFGYLMFFCVLAVVCSDFIISTSASD